MNKALRYRGGSGNKGYGEMGSTMSPRALICSLNARSVTWRPMRGVSKPL